MTDATSLVNLALQSFGSRTVITAAQLAAGSNNEAKQANLTFANTRDSLLRMAPWECALKTANLNYVTSIPGTPENTSAATTLWQAGQPRPPWAYEYQYPVDCVRACWIIPAIQTGNTGGVPITTAVTGGAPTSWLGAPISFKVSTDQFLMATSLAVTAPGSGYAIGDLITASVVSNTAALTNRFGTFNASQPQGAGAVIRVLTINGSGGVLTAELVNQLPDASPVASGSYFYSYVAAGLTPTFSTTGAGTGVEITLTIPANTLYTQRVILTNQEYATLVYCQQVADPNVWDPLFQDAFFHTLGADICMALTGKASLANRCIAQANNSIEEARKASGNEGLTVNDITPDWLRFRGVAWTDGLTGGPYSGFEWGSLLPSYA